MMASLGEKDDGQSRMGKPFLPSRDSRIPSSILWVNQRDLCYGWQMARPWQMGLSTEPKRAGLAVLPEADDSYERLARKAHLEE